MKQDNEAIEFDIKVENHFSLYILQDLTPTGKAWLDEHIPEDTLTWGGGIVVEPRYVSDIVQGMIADGLKVE
jgi:hypothetical protein